MTDSKQTVEYLEGILNKEGLQSNAYEAAARALVRIAKDNPELIQSSTVQALEGILTKERLRSITYEVAAIVLSYMAVYNSQLIHSSTVQALEGILNKEGLQSNAYEAAARALVRIAKDNPELIQPSTVQALEGILTKEGLQSDAYWASATALPQIAIDNPQLIQSSTVQVLEGILTKEGLQNYAYRAAAYALSRIAIAKPELFAQVYSVIQHLIESGKGERIGVLKEVFTTYLPESVSISLIANIQPEGWSIILNAIDESLKPTILKDDVIKLLFAPSTEEKIILSMKIKQSVYRAMISKNVGKEIVEYSIPDYMKDGQLFGLYTAFYKLPWETFVKDFDAFHSDPQGWKKRTVGETRLGAMDLPIVEESFVAPPDSTNMAEVKSTNLRNIKIDDQLARSLKEVVISRAFNHKVVLAFEDSLGRYQNHSPLQKVRRALGALKDNPAYSKILKNLEIIVKPADSMAEALEEPLKDPNANIFVFASAREEIKAKLSRLDNKVSSVYIEEEKFEGNAYYPLIQVVLLALTHYMKRPLTGVEATKAVNSVEGAIDLQEMNIDSLRVEGPSLIVRLLPNAKRLETGELIKRYASILPFLESA